MKLLLKKKGINKLREDIFNVMKEFIKEGIKPNYSEIARRFNCDPRTVKRYYKAIVENKKG